MPYRKTPLVTGQYYHVYNRGVNKQPIFYNASDYERATQSVRYYQFTKQPIRYSYLKRLQFYERKQVLTDLYKSDKEVEIISYVFMPNHYHFLLLQLQDDGISHFLLEWQNSFARYINIKHKRSGPLFQGNFKAVRIEDDQQLVHVCRYHHLNPLTSYVVKTFENLVEYPWSSFPEYLGLTLDGFCSKEIILSRFSGTEDYKKFVSDQVGYQRELHRIKHLTLES